jgi:nucleoside-diphosphate-sugar epimerase
MIIPYSVHIIVDGGGSMRIFVTGAGGFIGQVAVKRLLADGHRVTALLMPHERAAVSGADVVRGDLLAEDSLGSLLSNHDAVLHLAGAVGFQPWKACRRVNVEGTRRVAQAAVAAGVTRFVHMSSVSVYGRVPDVPITEESPLRFIGDPYGDTKIEAERLLRELEASARLALTVLRPTVVYGRYDRKFALNIIDLVRGGKVSLPGDGRNRVDLVHVDDLAALVSTVLRSPASVGRTYNVTHPDNPTLDELVRELGRLLGVRPRVSYIPFPLAFSAAFLAEQAARVTGKPPRLSRYSVRVIGRRYDYVTARVERELGFRPGIGLFDGMKDVMEHAHETV